MSEAAVPRPVPAPEGLNAEWYAWCHRRELRFQRCGDCGRWRHPPRVLCEACGSDAWSWEPSTGAGVVFSWTVTHQATHPAFASEVPYAVLVVELDEGVRMVSGLRGLGPDRLRLDLPVEVDWEPLTDAITLPVFRPRS